jgi:glycosyltransferase 2 family protein
LDAARRRGALRAAGWILAAIVTVFVAYRIAGDLRQLRTQPLEHRPSWGWVLLSGLFFLLAHAVLVQTWRSVLSSWDSRLPFWTAARIWSISNLGRYLPGKIWQIGAMGAMSRAIGVSPVAATGSAILGTLVNVLAGFVVALASGRALLDRTSAGWTAVAAGVVVVAGFILLAAPYLLPRIAPFIARVAGRPLNATLPPRAVVTAVVGNVAAWLLYGAAFQLFVRGVLNDATGDYAEYLAAYTISYLAGYLALFAPAGAGVREGVMLAVLQYAGLASAPQAALVTIGSRVWLTLLEVTPGFLFWALHRVRRTSPTIDPSDVPT